MLAALTALLTAAAGWAWPVAGEVLRAFRVGPDPYAAGQHRGVDLGAPLGVRVGAACGGRVTFAGRVGDAGLVVTVACGRHLASHGRLGDVAVRRGALVIPGAAVGTVGRTGRPRGGPPHVHLSARLAASGRHIDPLGLLPRRGGVPAVPPLAAPRARRAPPPAPARAPVRAPLRAPAPPVAAPAARPRRAVPPLAWAGLAAVLAAVPMGALGAARRRRGAPGALGSLVPGWPSTSRRRSST